MRWLLKLCTMTNNFIKQILKVFCLVFLLISSCISSKDEKVKTKSSSEISIMDSVELHFPDKYPVSWGQIAVLDSGFLYLYMQPGAPMIYFNTEGKFTGRALGIGDDKNNYSMSPHQIVQNSDKRITFVTLSYMMKYVYDTNLNLLRKDALYHKDKPIDEYELMLPFAKENITGVYDKDAGKMFVPLETTSSEIALVKFQFNTILSIDDDTDSTNIFAYYPELYRQNKNNIPYDHRKITLDVNSDSQLVYQSAPASHKIQVYSYTGEFVREFGQKGRNIKRDEVFGLRENDEKQNNEMGSAFFHASYHYLSIRVKGDTVFRTYVEDLSLEEAKKLKHGQYSKRGFMQVYVKEELISELSIPFRISPLILRISEKGELIFKSKSVAKEGEEAYPVRIYKAQVR